MSGTGSNGETVPYVPQGVQAGGVSKGPLVVGPRASVAGSANCSAEVTAFLAQGPASSRDIGRSPAASTSDLRRRRLVFLQRFDCVLVVFVFLGVSVVYF